MGFFVEDSGLTAAHLLYKAALVLALLRWAFSWAVMLSNRAPLPSSAGSDSVRQSHPVHSSRQIRDSLMLTIYGDFTERVSNACDTCAVCLRQLIVGDEVRELMNCRHVFHKNCIDRWVDHCHGCDQDDGDDNHKTCPLCRAPLLTASQGLAWTRSEPSWAVERILYLFGDDLLM